MSRFARVIAVDVPHHVTQRGNGRQVIFSTDADRAVYMDLLRRYAALHELSLVGYCLMSNHVHLIAVPHSSSSLAQTLKQTHGRYAAYWNARQRSSGHVWQGRFYSCPLGERHLWEALRYIELNPVRAGMMAAAEEWPWSSAAAHCGTATPGAGLDMQRWRTRWSRESWREFLTAAHGEAESNAIRTCTHTGRPLGDSEFVKALEQKTSRRLAPQKGGRPPKSAPDTQQVQLVF